jgi:hypothetical protein
VSQPAERTETLRTSRNAIKIINQADLHVDPEQARRAAVSG